MTMIALVPVSARGQSGETRRAQRKVAEIVTEFDVQLRGYERELKYFERTREFRPLLELRNRLVEQAAELAQLDRGGRGQGPAILRVAREMDHVARRLDAETRVLEKHADAVSSAEGKAVAARMRDHADAMVRTIDQLIGMFR